MYTHVGYGLSDIVVENMTHEKLVVLLMCCINDVCQMKWHELQ